MLKIDNIEKYLIVVYSKLKENVFGADIAKNICTQVQYLIIKPGIKKIWNGCGGFFHTSSKYKFRTFLGRFFTLKTIC